MVLGASLVSWLTPKRETRIRALLNAEYLLLLSTIFIPVAMERRIATAQDDGIGWRPGAGLKA